MFLCNVGVFLMIGFENKNKIIQILIYVYVNLYVLGVEIFYIIIYNLKIIVSIKKKMNW